MTEFNLSALTELDRDFTSVYCLSRVKVLQTLIRSALLNAQENIGNFALMILDDGSCEKLLLETGTHCSSNIVACSCS